jgi:uncharacterized protein involved in oxidation of intracellular sulfur
MIRLYGTERLYNALRLTHAFTKRYSAIQVTMFLIADAVLAAKAQQKTPAGYYNGELMLKHLDRRKGPELLCGTCMDACGISNTEWRTSKHDG